MSNNLKNYTNKLIYSRYCVEKIDDSLFQILGEKNIDFSSKKQQRFLQTTEFSILRDIENLTKSIGYISRFRARSTSVDLKTYLQKVNFNISFQFLNIPSKQL